MIHLLLLSEDPVALDELESNLQQRLPALRVIGKCYTWVDGARAAQQLQPDVIVIDGSFGKLDKVAKKDISVHCKVVFWLTKNDKAVQDIKTEQFYFISDESMLLHYLTNIKL